MKTEKAANQSPSTAVIFSGQMRTFTVCAPLFKWQVMRHYPNADVFISTTQDEDTAPAIALAHQLFPADRLFIDITENQPDFPALPHSAHCPPPFENSVPIEWILRQWWQHKRAWKFYELQIANRQTKHRTIIRARADSFFHDFMPVAPANVYAHTAYVPWWGRFGGCNDRFAIMGRQAAEAYFSIFDNLNPLLASGCPMHAETVVMANLQASGIIVRDNLRTTFSTLRKSGEMRYPEVSHSDIAHASLYHA